MTEISTTVTLEKQENDPQFSALDVLPNELLANIFSSGTKLWREVEAHELPFPTRVSSVCRLWHMVAWQTPDLWNIIFPPLHKLKSSETGQKWTAQWLERSGDLPLTIVLDDLLWAFKFTIGFQTSKQVLEGIMQAIIPFRRRVRRIDLSLMSYFEQLPFNSLLEFFGVGSAFEQLEHFTLCRPIGYYKNRDALQSAFTQIPNLRYLRWNHTSPPLLENLTTISIQRFKPLVPDVQELLSSCPHLNTLILLELSSIPEGTPLPLPILAPSLTSLAVSINPQSQTLTYPFAFLKLPNLKYLELEGPMHVAAAFRDSLSVCKLEKLRLCDRPKGSSKEDQRYLKTLIHDAQSLELVESAAEDILFDIDRTGPRRKRSIGTLFRPPPSSSDSTQAPTTLYPHLKTITLDTFASEEVMHVCRFINLHRQVERVNFSAKSRRHVSSSLQRNGDIISLNLTLMTGKKVSGFDIPAIQDVEAWLSRLVDIRTIEPPLGLLDGEKVKHRPFRELN